jgi:acyl-lipid omega-6 desaturase (Delta-12 desaturase)
MNDGHKHRLLLEPIGAKEVKSVLRPFTHKRLILPLVIFLLDSLAYIVLIFGSVMLPTVWQRFSCGALGGLAVGLLFLVGHDACHGSFTRFKWVNEVLGRVAFFPCLHAFSLWNLGHNQIHHRFTNLKTEDYVWRPYSKEEFDGLPKFRQWTERLYRSIGGVWDKLRI